MLCRFHAARPHYARKPRGPGRAGGIDAVWVKMPSHRPTFGARPSPLSACIQAPSHFYPISTSGRRPDSRVLALFAAAARVGRGARGIEELRTLCTECFFMFLLQVRSFSIETAAIADRGGSLLRSVATATRPSSDGVHSAADPPP